jgi:bifunctional non-homologous end joining protein LigD
MTPRKRTPTARKSGTRAGAATKRGAATRSGTKRSTAKRSTATRGTSKSGTAKRPTIPREKAARGGTPTTVETQLLAIERDGGEGTLDLGRGVSLHVSSLGKLYFPDAGITKGALMRYYTRVSPLLLPHLEGRPLILKRYPEGVGGQMFFQQDAGPHVPDVIRTQVLSTVEKGDRARFIGGDLATLLYTVQLGAIEVHPWLSRVSDIDSADRCLIDLDPGDDVPFSTVVSLAREVLRVTEECGLSAAVKTSGSSGIHLVIALPPHTSYDTSVRLATLIAQVVVAARPEDATVERSIGARPAGTIYVDALQNARGKSAASAYSVRAKPHATVSAPLAPRELTGAMRMTAFTVKTMPARVAKRGDMFGEALAERPVTKRALTRALEVLETTLTATRPQRRQSRSGRGGAGA